MNAYKERTIMMDYPSEVYFNLHKKVFSMVQDGLVVLHTDCIVLSGGVKFKVSEAGRQRVLAEGRKNVHAKVVGEFVGTEVFSLEGYKRAHYNPYEGSTFVNFHTGKPVHEAEAVVLIDKKIFYR